MSDLLKTLGEAARDDRARAPEGDDEAAAAAPLDERAREAMVEAALAALAGLPEAPAPRLAAVSAVSAVATKRPAPAAAPPPIAARLVRWHYGAAAVLAFAASIAFLIVFRPSNGGGDGDALPAYSLSVSGSVSELRGENAAPSASAKVRPDATLTLVVRPEAPVARALEARAFVEQNGALRRIEVPVEISPEGALRLVARADRLFDPPRGTHRLFVAVGPRGALPEAASLEALRGARGVRLAEARVTVEAP